MNKRYISPEVAVYDITAVTLLSTSTRNIKIIDSDSGGDDGHGGYNPENSLSRQNDTDQAFGNDFGGEW